MLNASDKVMELFIFLIESSARTGAGLSDTIVERVLEQLFASVTVTVYVEAVKPEIL